MIRIRAMFVLLLACASFCASAVGGDDKPGKFVSSRTQHKFLGATQLALSNFSPMEKDPSSAKLVLDANDFSFSPFGEPRLTTVFYKPVDVKLTRLKIEDTTGAKRRVFTVELPKEQRETLGTNVLQLVWPIVGAKSQPRGVRLMLVDPAGKVQQTVELWPGRDL